MSKNVRNFFDFVILQPFLAVAQAKPPYICSLKSSFIVEVVIKIVVIQLCILFEPSKLSMKAFFKDPVMMDYLLTGNFSGVLLAYLSAGLGDSLTPQMETAWTKFLDIMVNVVEEEMDHLEKGI